MTRRYALRACWADLTSRDGFQWPWPGGKVRSDDNLAPGNMATCPTRPGDGLCLAKTAHGAASGGIPLHTVLVCSFDGRNVLAEDDHKIRVKGLVKVESVHDYHMILRGERPYVEHLPTATDLYGADLSSANLSGADLSGADLSRANLSGANLYRANLYRANLSSAGLFGADLSSAYLYRAIADRATVWPQGFNPKAAGVVIR